jgi:hypothetical protein
VRANYTFSKTIDENSSDVFSDFNQSDRLPTPLNFRQNRGPSDFSLQHVFSANFSYSTPSLGNGAASGIFGRWEIYGIAQLGSGFPFAPEIGFDRAQLGEGLSDRGQRPDFIGAPGDELILGDPSRWFNPFLFALPPEGFYGNLGRGALRGPGQVSLDVALQKRIWVKEPHAISLRAEFFNVANHPNFRLPAELELFSSGGEVLSSAGRITATSSTSRQIQLSLRWQF